MLWVLVTSSCLGLPVRVAWGQFEAILDHLGGISGLFWATLGLAWAI